MQFLTKNVIKPIVHPSFSPDLASCDFFLFPRLKKNMKGKRFDTVEEVKQKSPKVHNDIPINEF
jgi:[histone H3]-lysine36 N-dimethyltransferase SETMAR